MMNSKRGRCDEDDICNLVGDSFSDAPSDDSGSWMQRIDVSNFRQLTTAEDEREPTPFALDHGGYAATARLNWALDARRPPPPPPADLMLQPMPSPDDAHSAGLRTDGAQLLSSAALLAPPPPLPCVPAASLGPPTPSGDGQVTGGCAHPKPIYSYSCLIALALKNSKCGRLTVAEIYSFMCENFPYFQNAPAGWKNSVRHNLSLNKCFEKIELDAPGGHGRKSCLWMLNPSKLTKMDQEIRKWREKDPTGVREALSDPDDLELIEKGLKGFSSGGNAYFLPSFNDMVPSAQQSQLLLVRSSQLPFLGYSQPQSFGRPLQTSVVAQPPPSSGVHSWPSANKMARVASYSQPGAARTPPPPLRVRSVQDVLSASPQLLQSAAVFGTPPQQAKGALQFADSSPFSHTPPYSPNLCSPQHKPFGADLFASTPRTDALDASPSAKLFAAYHNQYSPCKVTGQLVGHPMGPFETATSALSNNSLLQTALAQSPYKSGLDAPVKYESL